MPVCDKVVRSADSSHVSRAPRCTPPRPPVANAAMPARAARCAVEATVVAALAPRATAGARSRTPAFITPSPRAIASSAASSRPTRPSPATTAIVAGTAPAARTAASASRATRRLSGAGRPWAMSVLSSATTPRPARSAPATSGSTITRANDAARARPASAGGDPLALGRAGAAAGPREPRLLAAAALALDLVERLAGVRRREQQAEQRARRDEAGEDPGERVEPGRGDRGDEEAPDAEA